jgi:hypothetical protein
MDEKVSGSIYFDISWTYSNHTIDFEKDNGPRKLSIPTFVTSNTETER